MKFKSQLRNAGEARQQKDFAIVNDEVETIVVEFMPLNYNLQQWEPHKLTHAVGVMGKEKNN